MDFVQGIGERYLMGKANAAPQMLENLAKEQFKSTPDPKAEAAQASTLPKPEKNDEIAKLRKELAEMRLQNGKAEGKAENAKDQPKPSRAKSVMSEKTTSTASKVRSGRGSGKAAAEREMKGSMLPDIVEIQPRGSEERKSGAPSRGRSASISTATAAMKAKARKAASEANGGGHALSKPGNASHSKGPDATSAREALQGEKSVRKAAASAAPAYASSTIRSHSMGQQSESGGENERRGGKVAARPPSSPPPPPRSLHRASREREPAYEQRAQKSIQSYQVEEPGLYIVEVEEDVPRRRPKTTRYQGGSGGVVEIQKSQGRTLYRVS